MRKLLIPLLFLSVCALASTDKNIKFHTSGQVYTFAVDNISKITFGVEDTVSVVNLFFNNSEEVVSYPSYCMGISFDGYTGIEDNWAEESDVTIKYNNVANEISLSSVTEITSVSLYSASGNLVLDKSVLSNTAVLSIEGLVNGVYLVKAISAGVVTTHKIIKR